MTSNLGLRIVEVEQAPCQHMHSGNYGPAKVIKGQPVEPLPDNQHKCFDCGEFFTLQLPPPAMPGYTLKEIEALAKQWNTGLELTHGEQRVVDWAVSNLIAHLARREREGRG